MTQPRHRCYLAALIRLVGLLKSMCLTPNAWSSASAKPPEKLARLDPVGQRLVVDGQALVFQLAGELLVRPARVGAELED